jgi:hypothetical protein
LKDFLGVVEYNLTLWNHLQSPLELSSIHDRVRVIETEVSQKKSILASLPPGESQVAMTTIMSKTKEIVVARVEQQTITKLVIDADYKVLSFYT